MNTIELGRTHVFVMDGGTLTVTLNGEDKGWATLVIKEDQLLVEEGYATWEIPPSELRQLRDFLNKRFPV